MSLLEISMQAMEETNAMTKEQVTQVALLAKSRAIKKRLQVGKMDFLGEDPSEISSLQLKSAKASIFVNIIKEKLKCSNCDEKHPACIDFHHIKNKSYSISRMVAIGRKIEDIQREILKCILLCSNCHRKEHYNN